MAAIHNREKLPLTVRRHRIFILPTRFGVQFGFILLAMLLGSINYNNNLAFLLTFLLSSMVLVSIVHTYRNLAGLIVQSCRVRPVFAGESASYEITLRKNSRAGALTFSFRGGPEVVIDMQQEEGFQLVTISFQTLRRGYCQPERLTVAACFPFGLFRAWSVVYLDLPCLVYPRPRKPKRVNFAFDESDLSGHERSLKKGSDDFDEMRVYSPGDSLNQIAWKIHARGQGLFTKQFVDHVSLVTRIDWDSISDRDIEGKLSEMCYLILQADKQYGPYSLRIPGAEIGPGQGEAHRHLCLEKLALFNNKGMGP